MTNKEEDFKEAWAGRSFICNTTKEIFTVPSDTKECSFYQWGEAYVDVGRLGFYARFSNCSEILEGEDQE